MPDSWRFYLGISGDVFQCNKHNGLFNVALLEISHAEVEQHEPEHLLNEKEVLGEGWHYK